MTNMNTNANTDKIIDFLDDLTNKVGEGKHITLLAEKQDWFDAKRTLAQERLYGWDEGDVIVDNDGNIFTFDDDNSWHVEHLTEEQCRLDEIDGQVKTALSEHVTKASERQESVPEANWSLGFLGAKPEGCPESSSVSQESSQHSCWT